MARIVLDVAEARELADRANNPRLKLAVDALDGAALFVLRELVGAPGIPGVSTIVARGIAEGDADSSSLRRLGRDLRGL